MRSTSAPRWARSRRALTSAAALAVVALGSTHATATSTQFPGLELSSFDERQMSEVVRTAYSRLQELVRASGNSGFTIEVESFETIYPGDFGRVYWFGLVDMPEGRVVDVVRQAHRASWVGEDRTRTVEQVSYRATWQTLAAEWQDAEWAAKLPAMAVSEVLSALGEGQPALRRASSVSSFRVRVNLEGETRHYRAAVVWVLNRAAKRLDFFVQDHIVQGVEAAIREPVAAAPAKPGGRGLQVNRLATKSARCFESNVPSIGSAFRQGTNGHTGSNYHRSDASFSNTCACNYYCSQTCTAAVTSSNCYDTGGFTSDACHKMAQDVGGSSQTVADGHVNPASCGAGFGCIQKACLFCSCSLGVSVSSSGASVSFNSFGSPDWDGSLQYGRTCTPCSTITDDEGDDDDDDGGGGNPPGGGGGGGGNPPLVDECDPDGDGWVTESECVLQCGGTVNGEWCDL